MALVDIILCNIRNGKLSVNIIKLLKNIYMIK